MAASLQVLIAGCPKATSAVIASFATEFACTSQLGMNGFGIRPSSAVNKSLPSGYVDRNADIWDRMLWIMSFNNMAEFVCGWGSFS